MHYKTKFIFLSILGAAAVVLDECINQNKYKTKFKKGKLENENFEKEIKNIKCNGISECNEKIKNINQKYLYNDNFQFFNECKQNENNIAETISKREKYKMYYYLYWLK